MWGATQSLVPVISGSGPTVCDGEALAKREPRALHQQRCPQHPLQREDSQPQRTCGREGVDSAEYLMHGIAMEAAGPEQHQEEHLITGHLTNWNGRASDTQGAWETSPRDALEEKGPQRRPQRRLDRRLEEVAEAVGGGYCRLQIPLKLALGVGETVAGHRLGALEGGGGSPLPLPMHP